MEDFNEICERIKSSLDIAEIIGERVQLRKSTRGYVGLCPFHNENTPSFHVYTDTRSFYCFGCKEAGDVFTFLMKIDGLEFRDALKILADRAGVELPKYEKSSGVKSDYEVMELAAKFYRGNLTGAAKVYVEDRKLDAKDVDKFALGYAPPSWDALTRYLRENGIPDSQMLNLGLAIRGKHGLYDTFRGRLIFPIRDLTGKVIAFGGRLIDGEGAKYINSPDSRIFSKRKNLYMMNAAKSFIHDKKRSILVEGYMDAIRLHKCGYREAVASCGTSLTPEQANMLSRYAERCYICYDNDKAGQKATLKGMYILAQNGLDVRVIKLFQGKDPDEFLSINPPEKFEELITQAKPLVLHHLEILAPEIQNLNTRKSALRELFNSLSQLDVAEVLLYKLQLSEVTGIPPSKIIEYFSRSITNKELISSVRTPMKSVECPLEAGLCALLYKYSDCRLAVSNSKSTRNTFAKIVQSPMARELIDSFFTDAVENMKSRWLSSGEVEKIALITRGEEYCSSMINLTPVEKLKKIAITLRTQYITQRIQFILNKMRHSQATMEEITELQQLKRLIS